WWMAVKASRDWHLMGGAATTSIIFFIAAVFAPFAPGAPRYIWTLGFIAPFIAGLIERRRRGALGFAAHDHDAGEGPPRADPRPHEEPRRRPSQRRMRQPSR